MRTKLGAPKAITAMVHRLARLVYRMLKYGQQYVDKGAEHYEQRNRQQRIKVPQKKGSPTRLPGHTNPGLKLSTKKVLRNVFA
jgi:hypothetical protein